MITPQKEQKRHKVNFMMNEQVLVQLKECLPAGERSDFVNHAVEEALLDLGRKKAAEAMDAFRKEGKWKITTEEFIRLKNYGRD